MDGAEAYKEAELDLENIIEQFKDKVLRGKKKFEQYKQLKEEEAAKVAESEQLILECNELQKGDLKKLNKDKLKEVLERLSKRKEELTLLKSEREKTFHVYREMLLERDRFEAKYAFQLEKCKEELEKL